MRKTNQQTIGEVIQMYIRELGMQDKFLELKIKNLWGELFGKAIVTRTQNMVFKNGILTVYLSSGVLKDEFVNTKSLVLKRLNQSIGFQLIKELHIR